MVNDDGIPEYRFSFFSGFKTIQGQDQVICINIPPYPPDTSAGGQTSQASQAGQSTGLYEGIPVHSSKGFQKPDQGFAFFRSELTVGVAAGFGFTTMQ